MLLVPLSGFLLWLLMDLSLLSLWRGVHQPSLVEQSPSTTSSLQTTPSLLLPSRRYRVTLPLPVWLVWVSDHGSPVWRRNALEYFPRVYKPDCWNLILLCIWMCFHTIIIIILHFASHFRSLCTIQCDRDCLKSNWQWHCNKCSQLHPRRRSVGSICCFCWRY